MASRQFETVTLCSSYMIMERTSFETSIIVKVSAANLSLCFKEYLQAC